MPLRAINDELEECDMTGKGPEHRLPVAPGTSLADIDKIRKFNFQPISKLHEDVLWEIFMINADMTNDQSRFDYYNDPPKWKERALILTWSCSHVCRQWRGLILNSSSLWGRLVDLDVFAKINSKWRDEIFCRTGLGDLTVKGRVCVQVPAEQDFFHALLRDHWPRIQNLDVTLSRAIETPNYSWDIIFRPAPALRSFCLDSRSSLKYQIPLTPSSGQDLFGNNAPLIRDFQCRRANFILRPEMQWLSGLRKLDVQCTTTMSVTEWLRALGQMPDMEYLSLQHALPNPPDTNTSALANLPRLGEIVLINPQRACTVLLAQIIPQIGCHLYMTAPDSYDSDDSDDSELDPPFDSEDQTLTGQVLTRYSQNVFNHLIIEDLSIFLSLTRFCIDSNSSPYSSPTERLFEVHIAGGQQNQLPILPLLGAFSLCDFSNVTSIDFETDSYSLRPFGPTVYTFLLSLQSVETLVTHRHCFFALNLLDNIALAAEQEDKSRPHLFPKLRTLKVQGFGTGGGAETKTFPAMISFLTSPRRLRAPIEILDLTHWENFDKLNIFDGISGLKVMYRDGQCVQEHICGRNWRVGRLLGKIGMRLDPYTFFVRLPALVFSAIRTILKY